MLYVTCFGNKYFNEDVEKNILFFSFPVLLKYIYQCRGGGGNYWEGTLRQKFLYEFVEEGGKIILGLVANFANPAFITICYLFGLHW